MNRNLAVVSIILVLAGLVLMSYSDPAVRAGLGFPNTTQTAPGFPRNGTETFTGGFPFSRSFSGTFSGTFSFPTRGLTAVGGRGIEISTTEQEEAVIGLGLVAIGVLLEAFQLFLWEPSRPSEGAAVSGKAS